MTGRLVVRAAYRACVLLLTSLSGLGCEVSREVKASRDASHDSCDSDVSGYTDGRWTAALGNSNDDAPVPVGPNVSEQVYWFGPMVRRLEPVLWWPNEGDVHVKMTYVAATVDGHLASARMVALVDGMQVTLLDASGVPAVAIPIRAPAGTTTVFEFTIPEDAIEAGSHNLALVPINETSGQTAATRLFTVLKGTAGFSVRRNDTAATMEVPRSAVTIPVLSNNAPLYQGRPLESVGADGTIPLDLRLRSNEGTGCDGAIPILATAFVDFKQVSFDNFGPFVRVLADSKHAYTLSVVAHGPPPDTTRHIVTVLQYQGDGLYQAAPPGDLLPEATLRPAFLGNVYY